YIHRVVASTSRRSGSTSAGPSSPHPSGSCPITELFQLLGKPHVLNLIYLCSESADPLRFSAIQARLPLSPNTLSDRLRDLVASGLLLRIPYREIPPRVDYVATKKLADPRPTVHC